MKAIKIEDLYTDAIESSPVDADWSVGALDYDGSGEGWSFWESVQCEKCGKTLVLHNGGGNETHRDVDCDSECEGHIGSAEGPMMSYYYPLPIRSDEEAEACAAKITTCLCVVRVGGQYGLALTGGGMDLSWQICQAFVECGYLPPTHFDLPGVCEKLDATKRCTFNAMMRSLAVQSGWLLRKKERLAETVKQMRARDRKVVK